MVKLSPKKPLLLLKQYSDKNIQNFLLIFLFIFASLFIYQGCKINKNNIEDIHITSKLIENRSLLKAWIVPENTTQNVSCLEWIGIFSLRNNSSIRRCMWSPMTPSNSL